MSLWLGITRIGERSGLIGLFARAMAPLFTRLFPGIPRGHPAGGSIVMNFSANMPGPDNAATPLGLKAMRELQAINPTPEVASNPMVMFLVLNTAGITLIPTAVIAMRRRIAVEQGLTGFDAADIFLPTLIGTFISFAAGLVAVAWMQRIRLWQWPILLFFGGFGALMSLLYLSLRGLPPQATADAVGLIGSGVIFGVIVLFVAVGALRRINVCEAFVDGAKEGFQVAVTIIPYLIAILAAISVFRSTGCMDVVIAGIALAVGALGLNADFVPALPVGLVGAIGVGYAFHHASSPGFAQLHMPLANGGGPSHVVQRCTCTRSPRARWPRCCWRPRCPAASSHRPASRRPACRRRRSRPSRRWRRCSSTPSAASPTSARTATATSATAWRCATAVSTPA